MRVPQESPLSPVVFLIWMAPILVKIEERVKEATELDMEIPSFVDDMCADVIDGTATWITISNRRDGNMDNNQDTLVARCVDPSKVGEIWSVTLGSDGMLDDELSEEGGGRAWNDHGPQWVAKEGPGRVSVDVDPYGQHSARRETAHVKKSI